MAIDLRIAAPTRINRLAIPSTNGVGEIARSVGRLANAAGDASRLDTQMDQREADLAAQIEAKKAEEEDQQLALHQSQRLAELQAWEQQRASELALDADNMEETLRTERAERLAAFDAGFGGNSRVRDRFALPVTQFVTRSDTTARVVVMRAKGEQQAQTWTAMLDTLTNTVTNSGTPQSSYNEALVTGRAAIANMTAHTAEGRAAMERALSQRLSFAVANNLINKGHDQQVQTMIDSGQFDQALTPAQMNNLRGQNEAAARARAAAAEQQASEQRRVAREAIALMRARISAGEQPTPGEIEQVRAQAAAAGLPADDQYQVGVMVEDAGDNAAFRNMTGAQLQRMQAELQPKITNNTATLAEQRRFQRLPDMIRARTESAAVQWGNEYRTGGEQGQSSVATRMRTEIRDGDERFNQAQAIAPGFGYVVELPNQRYRDEAIRGSGIVSVNRDQFAPAHVAAAARRSLGGAGTSGALRTLNGEGQGQIIDLARNIYAGRGGTFTRDGPSDSGKWAQALNIAVGGEYRDGDWRGGIGRWRVNGRAEPYVLPGGYSASQFSSAITRADYRNARDASGNPVSQRDVITRAYPVYAGTDDGFAKYYMEYAPGVRLLNRSGTSFMLRVRVQ